MFALSPSNCVRFPTGRECLLIFFSFYRCLLFQSRNYFVFSFIQSKFISNHNNISHILFKPCMIWRFLKFLSIDWHSLIISLNHWHRTRFLDPQTWIWSLLQQCFGKKSRPLFGHWKTQLKVQIVFISMYGIVRIKLYWNWWKWKYNWISRNVLMGSKTWIRPQKLHIKDIFFPKFSHFRDMSAKALTPSCYQRHISLLFKTFFVCA